MTKPHSNLPDVGTLGHQERGACVPQDTDIARLVQKMDRLDALRDGLEGRIRYAEETMASGVEESGGRSFVK